MPDKLTDLEIKKALENEIHLAEYVDSDYCSNTEVSLLKATLDLINRQKAKIVTEQKYADCLNAEIERLKEEIGIQHKIVDERGKEVLRHDRCIRTLHEQLKTAKAEAYKECIEKVNNKIQFLENRGFSIHYVVKDALNNLLKELVGDK